MVSILGDALKRMGDAAPRTVGRAKREARARRNMNGSGGHGALRLCPPYARSARPGDSHYGDD
jgi:hypothetical protein